MSDAVWTLRRRLTAPPATAPEALLLDARPSVRTGSLTVVRGGPVERWSVNVPSVLRRAFGREPTRAELTTAHERLDGLTQPASVWTRSRLALGRDVSESLADAIVNPWPATYREPGPDQARLVKDKARSAVAEILAAAGVDLRAGKVLDEIRPGGELRWLVRLLHDRPGPLGDEPREMLRNYILRKAGITPARWTDPV